MLRKPKGRLANKCQFFLGLGAVLTLVAALAVCGWRMRQLVREGQMAVGRELAWARLAQAVAAGDWGEPNGAKPVDAKPGDADKASDIKKPDGITSPSAINKSSELPGPDAIKKPSDLNTTVGGALGSPASPDAATRPAPASAPPTIRLVPKDRFAALAKDDGFFREGLAASQSGGPDEWMRGDVHPLGATSTRFALAVRRSALAAFKASPRRGLGPPVAAALEGVEDPVEWIVLATLPQAEADRQRALNTIFLAASGLLAGLLAIGLFWWIVTRIVLAPLRVFREVADKVGDGDFNLRCLVRSGDELEQVSETLNILLAQVREKEDRFRKLSKSLDLKLDELSRSNTALYEANKVKSDFLANVSHELRTPLNSIVGFGEVLEETYAGQDKPKRYVANILTSSRHLLNLINDLLDLAKIDAGRLELHIGPMSVADTLEGLLNLMLPQAEKKGLTLELRVERNIPLVYTDAGRFQQIIFNFISNAIKFSPEREPVHVEADLVPGGPGPDGQGSSAERVRVSVKDRGPGISLEDQERIFEKFTQLDGSVTREHMGTGLGLAISRELAGLLQGRIVLESDTGKGATFTLILPVVYEDRSPPLMPQA